MLDTIRVTVSLSPIIHISVVSFSISKDLMEKKKNHVWTTYNYSVVLSSGEHWLDEKLNLILLTSLGLASKPTQSS